MNDTPAPRERAIPLGRNTLYNTAGSLIYLFCQWLLTLVTVRIAGYGAGGDYSLALSLSNVLLPLATFGLKTFVVSDREARFSPSEYMTTRILTCGAAMLVSFGMIAAGLLTGRHYTGAQRASILLMAVFRVLEAMTDMCQAFQIRAERMDYTFASYAARGVGELAVFAGVLAVTGSLPAALAAVNAVAGAMLALLDLRTAGRLWPFRLRFSVPRTITLLACTWPLMCNSFLMSLMVSLPRSTLEALRGSDVLGRYASVATPAVIAQSAAIWLYTPAIVPLTRAWTDRDRASWRGGQKRIWLMLLGAFLLAAAGARVLGEPVLVLLFNEEIRPYAYLLPVVLAATALIAASYFLSTLLTVARRLKGIAACNLIAAALTLLLQEPLIAAHGADGVNEVILIAMGVNTLLQAALLFRVSGTHFAGGDGKR